MDLADLGKLLDEWKPCRVVYFNTTQNDGVIAQVDLWESDGTGLNLELLS